ncbi:hypothetical protein SS50377_24505 [Spironucleus salmonicida]|uniref:Uncharacterized protein n=1 Tax=Spironucleus salmonicida TaxID=348837 RepID=V6LMN8_9EUKA|nr:hypothetical protein SS50377_24505 [Spironucleus salmonicida]|eukprot:EST45952.1 Hypothetical protein SS50377_13931 [Spironucleus salmonicida]
MNNIRKLLAHQSQLNRMSKAVLKQPLQILELSNSNIESFQCPNQSLDSQKEIQFIEGQIQDIPEFTGKERKEFRIQQEFVAKAVWVENKLRIQNGLIKIMIQEVTDMEEYVDSQVYMGIKRISRFQETLRKLAYEVQQKLAKIAPKKKIDVQAIIKQMDQGIYIQYQIPPPKKLIVLDF